MESVLIAINTFIFELEFKIMKKLNKTGLALGVALAVASTGAFAGTLSGASSAVGVEASTSGSLAATTVDSPILTPAVVNNASDRITITLGNGATFADATYTLFVSDGVSDANNEFTLTTATTAGVSSIEFRVASAAGAGDVYQLSNSSANADAGINVNLPSLAGGASVELSAEMRDLGGAYDTYAGVEFFEYANQFTAALDGDGAADETIDVETDRLTFDGNATTDSITLSFTDAGTSNGVTLNDNDQVDFVLSGDMTGIASIALLTDAVDRGDFTIAGDLGSATFSASASDVFAATSAILTATVSGSDALTTRSFTVQADVNFESETTKNVVAAGTAAGEWDINGLQAKVAHLSLNVSGFISWLKVVNEGTSAAEITADIIYSLADGTEGSVSNASLGEVDAGGVFTVSEASILTAIGSPTQVVDLSMTVTVAGQTDLIHLTAEKKASDGRTTLPVYYNTDSRNWVQ